MELSQAISGMDNSLVVVDDSLALPNFRGISDVALTALYNALDENESLLREMTAILGAEGAVSAAEAVSLAEEKALELWAYFSEGRYTDLLSPLFEELMSDYRSKRHRVDALISIVAGFFGVQPTTFSSLEDARGALASCAIAFVDYYAGDVETASEATDLHVSVRDVLCAKFSYKNLRWPKIVFLISSKLPSPAGLAIFRDRTGIKSAFFVPMDKKDIEQGFVQRVLDRCIRQYPTAVQLNNYLDSVHDAIQHASEAINTEISRLELHDLSVLKSLRLDAESESVQSYLTWLVSEALAAKVRTAPNLGKSLIPRQEVYVPLDGKLLPKSVLFELYSEIAAAPIPDEEEVGSLVIGDVFEVKGGASQEHSLVLVISPACDLVRCSIDYEVMCVRGILQDTSSDLSELLGKTYSFGKGKLVLKHLREGGIVYSKISWDKSRVCTIRRAEFNDREGYVRLARLSEVFAQEIKEIALSHMARVGTPIDPSFSVALKAFVRCKFSVARDVPDVEFQVDLASEDFVSAILAMGREAKNDAEIVDSPPLEQTALFSAQFQDFLLDLLMEKREQLPQPVPKLDNIIDFFGDSKNLRVVIGRSLVNGLVKVKYVGTLEGIGECKSGLEIWLSPYVSL